MSFLRFRALDAPANPLHAKYTAATGRTVKDAVSPTPDADGPTWTPVDTSQWQNVFDAMANCEMPRTTSHEN